MGGLVAFLLTVRVPVRDRKRRQSACKVPSAKCRSKKKELWLENFWGELSGVAAVLRKFRRHQPNGY